MEYRYQQQEGMDHALRVIPQVDEAFGQSFGRRYGGLFQAEMMEDAEIALLTAGSLASTARDVARELRRKGLKIGLVKLRTFRPFPARELREALKKVKCVAVLERDVSVGAGGILFLELSQCLYGFKEHPLLVNYILGLGGRDITSDDVRKIAEEVYQEREKETVDHPIRWYKVRGLP
jgi:pyruvate/2-oxoacid:ferredoxin oxidoreductase alpha subunit